MGLLGWETAIKNDQIASNYLIRLMVLRTVLYFFLFLLFIITLCHSKPTIENIGGAFIGLGATGFWLVEQIVLVRLLFFNGKLTQLTPIQFTSPQVAVGNLEEKRYKLIFFFTIPNELLKGRILLFKDKELIATKNLPKTKKDRNSQTFKMTKAPSFRLLKNPWRRGEKYRLIKSPPWKNPAILEFLGEGSGTFTIIYQVRFNNGKKHLFKNKTIGILLIRSSIKT